MRLPLGEVLALQPYGTSASYAWKHLPIVVVPAGLELGSNLGVDWQLQPPKPRHNPRSDGSQRQHRA